MTSDPPLCSFCQPVLSIIELDVDHNHHAGVQSFSMSAENGCQLCVLLWNLYSDEWKLSSLDPAKFHDYIQLIFRLVRHSEINVLMYQFRLTFPNRAGFQDDSDVSGRRYILVIPINDENDSAAFKAAENTGSEESWRVAKRWIDHCNRNHPECNQWTSHSWSPTRVLDVGLPGKPDLHLYITNQDSPATPYTTLSHCWGQLEIKQLRKRTLSSMIENIEMNELPKTFQDAIVITRRIGVRYLWIDSLCIIQDSVEDWTRESASMGEVYRSSICNIAATAAEDGRFGCFFGRNPLLAQPCRVRIESIPFSPSASGLYDLVPLSFWADCISEAPLNKRGWVLQEQYLSPRIIHCGKSQLLWECHQLFACEMYPNGLPSPYLVVDYQFDFKWPATRGRELTPASNQDIHNNLESIPQDYRIWRKIVENYTQRSLTNGQDKLIAISGVAKYLQRSLQDEYFAGLWDRHLPVQLLWRARLPIPPRARTERYCAPSWSWASVNSHIASYDYPVAPNQSFNIQILERKVETVTAMGQVSSGYLKLRGWLKTFVVVRLDIWAATLNGFVVATVYPDDPRYVPEGNEVVCLPILETNEGLYASDGRLFIHGLILSPTGEEDQYHRIGMFESYPFSDPIIFKRPFYPPISFEEPLGKAVYPAINPNTKKSGLNIDGTIDRDELHQEGGSSDKQNFSKAEPVEGRIQNPEEHGWIEANITII